MRVVVCYDIGDDNRRTRLYKRLQGFGMAVQRSVFECDLRTEEVARLRRIVGRYVDPATDGLRLYLLCEACARRVIVVAGRPYEPPPDVVIV